MGCLRGSSKFYYMGQASHTTNTTTQKLHQSCSQSSLPPVTWTLVTVGLGQSCSYEPQMKTILFSKPGKLPKSTFLFIDSIELEVVLARWRTFLYITHKFIPRNFSIRPQSYTGISWGCEAYLVVKYIGLAPDTLVSSLCGYTSTMLKCFYTIRH